MKNIVAFFVKHKIWANVIMISIFGFGIIVLSGIRYSFFPEITPNQLTVQVAFPGASPEEVEEGVVLKIEENLEGLEGIERVTSTSRENFGTVIVELRKGEKIDKILADVKNAVDRINAFPRGIEKPVIFEQKFRTRAVSIVLSGETDLYNLKYIADKLRDDLLATPEISQVQIQGLPNLEFSIEISESDLRKYKLTFSEIAAAVGSSNINISGGKFETTDEEILIRAYGRSYFAKELSNIVVRGNPDGTVIYLTDIADIKEKWEDVPDKIYYNNRTAVILNIDQTKQEDIIAIAERAKSMIAAFNEQNETIEAKILDNRTVILNQRLNLLIKNGLIGLMLVIITLGFFLNLHMSMWVSIGIPFSFAGMFIVAGLAGITINVISLFGMILVVGILVDDAIVVGENIFAHYERGEPALKAAINGTTEMLAPVFTSVITTILAFSPFFFLDGVFGRFIWQMALVVVASLAFSLVEAFMILPAHLAHSKGLHPHQEDSKLRKRFEKIIHSLTYKIYEPALKAALKHKWITIVTPISFVLLTVGLLGGGFIGATFFPFIDGDTLPVNISLVSGRQEADTDSVLARLERASWQVNEDLKNKREDSLDVILGIQRAIGRNDFGESGGHTGRLLLQLLDSERRNMESFRIAQRIRQKIGTVPEAQNIAFGRTSFFGKPVSISILGTNLNQLGQAREMLTNELSNFSTLKDVTDTNQKGRREINILLKPRAHSLGLTLQVVAGQVRQGFFGQEIQRIQRNKDEIRVWVRYREEDRSALGFLDQMRIRTPEGTAYPFSEVAEYSIERGITVINHLDRQREIAVQADLASQELDLPPILAEIRETVIPAIQKMVPDIRFSFEGQSRDQQKFQKSIRKAFPVALLGMFILVTLVFRSYIQAMMIFSLIPLSILGAIWGHGILGIQLNTLSIYGVIALSGIIINDSIVLMDQVNRNLRSGMKVVQAVHQGAISRLRPILLTTLTTAAGLGPIILEKSRQAQFLIPMAVSVAYGLIFGTVILLFVLPALILVVNRIRVAITSRISGKKVTPEIVEPAVKELESEFV